MTRALKNESGPSQPAYARKYGQAVIEAGYDICLIRPGTKRPWGNKWEARKYNSSSLEVELNQKTEMFGIGIKTAYTPLVDIDCYDEDVVAELRKLVEETLGESIVRIGEYPKTGIVYRADQPFPKIQSGAYFDEQGRRVKLEVLGEGQQFVAYAIHPDTKEPYRWEGKLHPAIVPANELHSIAREDAKLFADHFDMIAEREGWARAGSQRQLIKPGVDRTDPFADVKDIVGLSIDDQRAELMQIPGAADYDTWIDVGMACYHENTGSNDGRSPSQRASIPMPFDANGRAGNIGAAPLRRWPAAQTRQNAHRHSARSNESGS